MSKELCEREHQASWEPIQGQWGWVWWECLVCKRQFQRDNGGRESE